MVDSSTKIKHDLLSLSRGVCLWRWLVFRHRLVNDQAQAIRSASGVGSDDEKFTRFFNKDLLNPNTSVSWILRGLGLLSGCAVMGGALAYSGAEPVNLFLILGLFAFLPLVMTLVSSISYLSRGDSAHWLIYHLCRLTWRHNQVDLFAFGISQLKLAKLWILFQLQSLSLSFQLSAIVTFLIVITFNDVAFAWSSTLENSDGVFANLLRFVAAPWAFIEPMPGLEFIEKSKFIYKKQNPAIVLSGQWWSYLALAMFFYGLIPRLLFSFYLAYKFKKALFVDIEQSGDIERYLTIVREMMHSEPDQKEVQKQTSYVSLPKGYQQEVSFISWQNTNESVACIATFGFSRWAEDEALLRSKMDSLLDAIAVLVELRQIPTAELGDFIALIKDINPRAHTDIVALNDGQRNAQAQLKTWQLYAAKYGHQLFVIDSGKSK